MIAGGAGGLGGAFARWLSTRFRSKLLLSGRREQNPAIRQLLEEISANGGDAVYHRADIADRLSAAGFSRTQLDSRTGGFRFSAKRDPR